MNLGGRDQQHGTITSFFHDKGLSLSPAWLSALLAHLDTSSSSGGPTSSADFEQLCVRHFLRSDIRHSLLQTAARLPSDAPSREVKFSLQEPVVVQVIECHEIGYSLAQQLERLDAYEERQKPVERRVIRLSDDAAEDDNQNAATLHSTAVDGASGHASARDRNDGPGVIGKRMVKVGLQDAAGTTLYGIEARPIAQLTFGMPLGAKLILHAQTSVVHGVILLKPTKVDWLGGSVDSLNAAPPSSTGTDVVGRLRGTLETALRAVPVMSAAERTRAQAESSAVEDVVDIDDGDAPAAHHTGHARGGGRARGARGSRGGGARGNAVGRGRASGRGRGRSAP